MRINLLLIAWALSLIPSGATEPMETSTDWRQLWISTNRARWESKSITDLEADAKRGHAVAMYVLADKLYDTKDRSKYPRAAALRVDAGKAGLPQAVLDEAYGIYEVTSDARLRRHEIFEKAANTGYPPAQKALASSLESGKPIHPNPQRAVSLMRAAADGGERDALTMLAFMYSTGVGEPRGPEDKPIVLLQRAAERGDENAVAELASRYRTGYGVSRDVLFSIILLARAGKLNSEQQFSSDGFEQIDADTVLYDNLRQVFEKAFHSNDAQAFITLAQMQLDGQNTAVDLPRAAAFFIQAARAGDTRAAGQRDRVQSSFNKQQLTALKSEVAWMQRLSAEMRTGAR